MSAKLFVGNLDYSVTSDELRDHFSPVGNILDCVVVMDRYTGRSRGFGFVEFESEDEANKAIEEKNDTDLKGRKIRVSIAKPSEKGNGGGSSPKSEEAEEKAEEAAEEAEETAEEAADEEEEKAEGTEEQEESEK